MYLGICDMEANFVPGSGVQLGVSRDEWEKIEPIERLDIVLKTIQKSSFDYVELGIPWLNGTFFQGSPVIIKELMEKHHLKIGAYCSFVPESLKTVGSNFDLGKLDNYLHRILPICQDLGGETIVFGSGGSRMLQKGEDKEVAKSQIVLFLKKAAEIIQGKKFTLKIAIEPLNKSESNMINSLSEAYEIAEHVDSSYVGVLVDLFHAIRQDTSFWDDVPVITEKLFHVHVSQPENRSWPGSKKQSGFDFERFSNLLQQVKYSGNISVECIYKNLPQEIQKSYHFLDKVFR